MASTKTLLIKHGLPVQGQGFLVETSSRHGLLFCSLFAELMRFGKRYQAQRTHKQLLDPHLVRGQRRQNFTSSVFVT